MHEKARANVSTILDGYKLQDVSNWADEIRSEQQSLYKSFNKWHYMEAEEEGNIHEQSASSEWPEDLHQAINYCIDQLKKQPQEAKLQRAILLKMLIHLIGDAHQPLHVGNAKDRGATRCYVRWFYSKFPTTLHKVWDSKLIDAQHYSYSEYTDYLDHISINDELAWQKDSISVWLKESRQYHKQIYPTSAKQSTQDYCKINRKDVEYSKMPMLSYKYSYQMRPILEKRLQQAGIRLAGVLNKLWDS